MKLRGILVSVGWSVMISSIILQVLYVTPALDWREYVLLVLASLLSGALIVDLGDVILGYFLVLLFSFSIMTFTIGVLPSVTGAVQSGFMASDLLVSNGLLTIVKATFPGVWVVCLLAGIVGGGIGERLEPYYEQKGSEVQK